MNPFTALMVKLASPRTLLAIALSTGVTGVVAGPLTYEAVQARDAAAQVDQDGGGGTNGGGGGRGGDTTSTTSSTTSTSVTSTTTPGGGGSGGDRPDEPNLPLGGPPPDSGLVVPPPTTPGGSTPPPTRPPRPPAVLVSVDPGDGETALLAGTLLSGVVYLSVDGAAGDTVNFTVDGVPLDDGLAFGDDVTELDTGALTVGPHVLVVSTTVDGRTVTEQISFTVAR